MSELKPTTKKTLQNVFAEMGDRKIILMNGPQKAQDSRFAIAEVGIDHVAIKLLGEEALILSFSAITSVKVERAQVTISYR